jgi:hypothetical protein
MNSDPRSKLRHGYFIMNSDGGPVDLLAIEIAKVLREKFDRVDFMASCLTCHHWDAGFEICKKYQLRPPAAIIANSCIESYWDIDEIPF